VSQLSAASQPKLRAGCRLSDSAQQGDVLLIPEGVLRLVGPGRKILEHCDGQRTISEIVRDLQKAFPAVDPARIEIEVNTFLERLHQKGVLDIG
jgi:pyrroloquinoline quinone biosynthesis protein D